MRLHEVFTAEAVALDLTAADRDGAIAACVRLLRLDPKAEDTLLRVLIRREHLGSTGMGRGIAIPHCRSLTVQRLRMSYARLATPLPWESLDGAPVSHVFLIVAPPNEVSNQYLPTLGRLASFAKEAANLARLNRVKTPAEFFEVLGNS